MNLKEYLNIRNAKMKSKKALSNKEAKALGIRINTKGWYEANKELKIDDERLYKMIKDVLKSNTIDTRCKSQLEPLLHFSEDFDEQLLYLMENSFGYRKIGISKNPRKRAMSLSNSSGISVWMIAYWKVKSKAFDVEQYLHRQFMDFRVKGEWFLKENITVDSIEKNIKCEYQRLL